MISFYNITKLKGRSFNLKLIDLEKKEEANKNLFIENLIENIKEETDIYFYHNNFYVKEEGLKLIINKNKDIFKEINNINIFNPIKVKEEKLSKVNTNNDIINFLNERKNKTSNNEKGVASLIEKHKKNIDNLKKLNEYKKIVSIDFEYIEPNIDKIREIGYFIIDKNKKETLSRYIIINKFHSNEAQTKTESVRIEKMNEVENNVKPLFLDIDSALKLLYKDIENLDCLVGHNLNTELNILRNRFHNVDKIDSQYVFSIIKKEANFFSVEDMLKELKINHKKLHNAYNDSFYTYCALNNIFKNEFNKKINKNGYSLK